MRQIKKIVTANDILYHTDNGRHIFEKELGKIPNKCISSPLRNDKNPSFNIFLSNSNIWCYKDFSNNEIGNAITFISKLYNLSYAQSIEKLAQDFGLKNDNKIYNKIVKPVVSEQIIKKELIIDWDVQPFTKEGHKYWNQYGITEEFANENDVYQVKVYAINKKIIKPTDKEIRFVYAHRDINGKETNKCKILHLNVSKEKKWKTNVPNHWLWRTHKINKDCKDIFIVKSIKDSLVLANLGLCTIATQNESANILLENNYEWLESLDMNKIVCYGSDFQAWHESYLITYLTGWKYFNTPNTLNKYNIVDTADYYKEFGKNSLNKLLKQKGYV